MTADTPLNILAISGSLRAASLNTGLLLAAAELAPAGLNITIHPLDDVPLYNGELDRDEVRPAGAKALIAAVRAADGVLLATPEFNYGIPGVLKNALDWASRPAYQSVFAGKPVSIVSASPSRVGGARAQGQLKQVLLGMLSAVHPYPEFLVPGAGHMFKDGRLSDESTREHLAGLLANFAAWVRRLASAD